MDRPLTKSEISIARRERNANPGMSNCMRCQRPWVTVDHHSTCFAPSEGCSALCKSCWAMLTPEERLRYYKDAWIRYWASTPWEVYRAACLYERMPKQVEAVVEGFIIIGREPGYWLELVMRREDETYWIIPRLPPQLVAVWQEFGVTIPQEYAAHE